MNAATFWEFATSAILICFVLLIVSCALWLTVTISRGLLDHWYWRKRRRDDQRLAQLQADMMHARRRLNLASRFPQGRMK